MDSNGCSLEPELLTQPVLEIPLIGEVKRRRDVGEKHERRRRHTGLRRVQDADVPRPGTGGRMLGRHALDELVQLGRS